MSRRLASLVLAGLTVSGCAGGSSDEPTATAEATTNEPTVTSAAATPVTTSVPDVTESAASTIASTMPPTSAASSTVAPSTVAPATDPPATTLPSVTSPSIRELIDSGIVVNLAHAGGDQAAPHSTRFAFAEAVRAGANALEMDVQLTADGVLIVQHDDTVDKTTEATGLVDGLTLAEIQALDNAYWFSPQCWPCHDRPVDEYVYRGVRTGEVPPPEGYSADDFRVPTFREIATAFPDLPLDVEIKGEFPGAVAAAERLAAEIVELGRVDSVVVVSFDDEVVDAFHELAPDVAVSPGLSRLTEWFLNGVELEPYFEVLQLPPFQGDIEVVNADVVSRIHDEGRVVWVWPDDAARQENREFYATLLEYGVDGVIAGRPAEMTAAIAG